MARLATYGKHSGTQAWTDALRRHEDITTGGALLGCATEYGAATYGQLPSDWRSALDSDTSVSYIVFSYATPIAWYSEMTGEWVIPDVSYSHTTHHHQALIRGALAEIGQWS